LNVQFGLVVAKEKLSANGEYNLSGERYREGDQTASVFPYISLGDVCELYQPKTITQNELVEDGAFLVYGANGVIGRYDQYNHPEAEVVITCRGATCGTINMTTAKSWITGNAMVAKPIGDQLTKEFLFYLLKNSDLTSTISGSAQPQITRQGLAPFKIPLPPLDVQREIVAEIEGYQKIISGARAVLENYRPHIPIKPEWPMRQLNEVTSKITDGAHFTPTYVDSGVPFLRVTDITESNQSKKFIPREEHDELIKRCKPEIGDVLYSKNGTIGIAKLVDWDWEFSIFVSLALLKPKKEDLDPHYLTCFLNSDLGYSQATARSKSGTVTNLHLVDIKTMRIPLPPLATQQDIVAEIEAEQALVAANRELITRFEAKIQATLARVWGEAELQATVA
jgi:type I restriction enzyme M protein